MKNSGKKKSSYVAILSRIQAQSCATLCLSIIIMQVMHDCASILDSIAKKNTCSHCYLHSNGSGIVILWDLMKSMYAWENGVVHGMA